MRIRRSIAQWLDGFRQDLHFGLRSLRGTPLATCIMVGSVTLGIGVATAVFTLADVMLFRPLPFASAERLVVPYQTVRARAGARRDTVPWSFARYDVLRRAVNGFDDVGFATWVDGIVRSGDQDRPVRIEAVTRSMLTTLSIMPAMGRLFGADEDAADVPTTAAMISDRLWHTVYGGSPSIIGQVAIINGVPVTVVGVMRAGFNGFTVAADVWLPFRMMARIDPSARWTERLASEFGTVIARARPSLTMEALRRQLEAALPVVNQAATDRVVARDAERGVGVMTLGEARRHPLVTPMLQLMGVGVLTLLLTVCANLASILLARGHARRGEIGVRIAIGASQRRVGRQVLTESTLLAALGLPPGILLGFWCADGLARLRPALPQNWVLLRGTDLLAGASLAPNLRVLTFSALVAGLAALVFGVAPAVAAARVDAARLVTSAGDSHASPPLRGRQFLVTAQVALATTLLVTAGLMTRSLQVLLRADLGFHAEGVVALRLTSIDTTAAARVRRQMMVERLSTIAGVTVAATAACVPYDVACLVTVGVRTVSDVDAAERPVDVELHSGSAGYFRTMGIPIVAGRELTAEDTAAGRSRVVISETAARRLFGTGPAVGRQLVFAEGRGREMDIVGVAHDVRFRSVEAAASPAMYFLAGENADLPRYSSTLFVRTTLPTGTAVSTISREIRASGAPAGVSDVRSLGDIVGAETSSTRFVATLLLGFAASAALLAALGIYGVIAYIVAQRTREFGVRIVLGANERDLLRGMIRLGAALVGGGVAIGAVIAAGASRLVGSLLYGVSAFDVTTYLVVVVLIAAIGLLATTIPARRIARIQPADALRI